MVPSTTEFDPVSSVYVNSIMMFLRSVTFAAIALCSVVALPTGIARAGTEVPITRIDFAGAGGDFTHRTGTFVVPDRDTTVSAYGGLLRRYDVHIAKMIEVTNAVWCAQSADYQGVYWNYEAESGDRFMGQFYISCTTACQIVQAYGRGRPERTAIYHRGEGPEITFIPVLNLQGDKVPRFLKFVQTLKPKCIDNLCPGDVMSER